MRSAVCSVGAPFDALSGPNGCAIFGGGNPVSLRGSDPVDVLPAHRLLERRCGEINLSLHPQRVISTPAAVPIPCRRRPESSARPKRLALPLNLAGPATRSAAAGRIMSLTSGFAISAIRSFPHQLNPLLSIFRCRLYARAHCARGPRARQHRSKGSRGVQGSHVRCPKRPPHARAHGHGGVLGEGAPPRSGSETTGCKPSCWHGSKRLTCLDARPHRIVATASSTRLLKRPQALAVSSSARPFRQARAATSSSRCRPEGAPRVKFSRQKSAANP